MNYFQVTASYLLRDIIIVTTSSTLTNPFILISGDRQEDMKVNTWSPIILLKSKESSLFVGNWACDYRWNEN